MAATFVNSQVLPEEIIAQEMPRDGKKFKTMFGSQSLQCVTCQKMAEEFDWAISKVDPKKKVESLENSGIFEDQKIVSLTQVT